LRSPPTRGELTFSKRLLVARTRDVKIAFMNHSGLPHNITIATSSGTVLGATATFREGARALTLALRPGTYTFYCSVPGHRGGGMQGKLVVK
jgi:plastocyanin